MGVDNPPRNKQGRLGEFSLGADEPTDDALSLLGENALREDEPAHFGVTNTPTTFNRYLRRMPGFEGFWFSYRISSAVTSLNEANAASVHAVGWLERCDHGQ